MKNLNIKAEGDDTKVVVFWQAVQDGEHCVLQLCNLLTLHRPAHLVLGKRLSKDNLRYKSYIEDEDSVFWKSFQLRIVFSEVNKVSVNDLQMGLKTWI